MVGIYIQCGVSTQVVACEPEGCHRTNPAVDVGIWKRCVAALLRLGNYLHQDLVCWFSRNKKEELELQSVSRVSNIRIIS